MSTETGKQPSLGVTATRGVFWTGAGQIVRQFLGIVTSVILAWILNPQDFGLIAMAYVFIEFAQLFADFGIGAAIIQSNQIQRDTLSSSFWANLIVGTTLALLMILAAPAIAEFYGDPRLVAIIVTLSLTLLLSGVVVVPRAILQKEMRFDLAMKAQMIGSLAGSVTAVGLALNDFGVWSLVAQPLCGSGVSLVLALAYSGWRPDLVYSWSAIRPLVRFSTHVLGAGLLAQASRNVDKLLVGRFLGSAQLGFYSMAYQLMLYPLTHVASVIVKVLFPTFSRLQNELPRLRAAYLKSAAAVAMITFPMMIGLYLVSLDFVLVLFGRKWLPMLPVLQILCWIGMMQSISTTLGTLYLSTGNTRALFRFSMVSVPFTLLAFVVGLKWGIVGVATAYAMVSPVMTYIYMAKAFRLVGLTFGEFFSVMAPPMLAALFMGSVVWMSRFGLETLFPDHALPRFLAAVTIGIAAYVAASLLVNRRQINDLRKILTAASRRDRVDPQSGEKA